MMNSTLEFSSSQLQAAAYTTEEVKALSSNIGSIGIAPDFSNSVLATEVQNSHPLVDWLLSTSMATRIRSSVGASLAAPHKEKGIWTLPLPYTYGTEVPQDTSGACCWQPMDIAMCGSNVPLSLLCLADCDDIFDILVNDTRKAGSNDLTGYFQNPGETVAAAKERMARLSMAFLSAKNVILGTMTSTTPTLKKFHGLLEVMENENVLKVAQLDILSAFDTIGCRLDVLGGSNYVFAVHPLTYRSIERAIVPDRLGNLPTGWTKGANGGVTYHGIGFIQDKVMPVDTQTGTGEAWLLHGESTGLYMATGLAPSDERFKRKGFTMNNTAGSNCGSECTYYYNYGAAFNNNSNHLAMITDIPLDVNCMGSALNYIDGLITPETLVPMV